MEGLVFEERADDAAIDREYLMLVTEESWKDPETFGHLESPFENHVAMIARRSKDLGIVNEYSGELLALRTDLTQLQQTMMSLDTFYQMMCTCPQDFGMSQSFTDKIFNVANSNHEQHPGHENHDKHSNKDDDDWEIGPDGKRRRKINRRGWLFAVYR